MSNQAPSGPPPPYPGGYSTMSDYSAFPETSSGFAPAPQYSSAPQYAPAAPQYAPAPQPYAPMKDGGGSYPTQTYGPPGQVHGTTVVVAQPTVTLIQTFREGPVRTRCNHCQADIVTGIHYETGTFTWVICFVLWLVGLGLGCCLIPFCVDGCKDVIHTCPSCHQQIARYSRM